MARPKGFGRLQTPRDLLQKLRHDRSRMEADPDDVYAAFDFFVTADHILDWLYPDSPGASQRHKRQAHRDREPLLQIVSHLANGAKHFEAVASHHTSVTDISSQFGAFDPRSFSPRSFSPSAFSMPGLHVRLTDGRLEHSYVLADDVLDYWGRELS
jgi:hypothetical protein